MKSAILITGAGSGIGRALAQDLSSSYIIYAAVRNPADFDKFADNNQIIPVLMDVTDPVQIEDTRILIEESDHQLYGLINNAGIGPLGWLYSFTEEEMEKVVDINLMGPWRVTKAFQPQITQSKGCIITIGSRGGLVTKALFGPYCMTKFAMEAFTIALRAELQPFGVHVSIVEPGGIETSIGQKASRENMERMERVVTDNNQFSEQARAILQSMQQPSTPPDDDLPESETNRKAQPPAAVTGVVQRILEDQPSQFQFLVSTQWEGEAVLDELARRMVVANESRHLKHSLDQLKDRLEAQYLNLQENMET